MISISLLGASIALAQTAAPGKPPKSVDEIKKMIKKAYSDDLKVSDAAKDELLKLTADSVPSLFEILKKEKPCTASVAADAIMSLNPKYPGLVPAVTKLVRGVTVRSLFHWEEEMTCRREAAYFLLLSADGLRSILNLLKKGDTWEKQTAIFALDDFTEVAGYNDHPGQIDVMKEVIPALAKLQRSKDRIISEMSYEVLGQISRREPKELSELAKNLLIDYHLLPERNF